VPAGFNCYMVETDTQKILIETGGGDRHDDPSRKRMNLSPERDLLLNGLHAAGHAPGEIDLVINTHLHWDHCGGNTIGNGEPTFPNARYVTQRSEWEHAQERHPRDAVSYRDINYAPLLASGQMELIDGDAVSYRDINYAPLLASGQMELIDGDAVLAPGIRVQVVRGHNASMMIVLVESQGETFCLWADLIPLAVNLPPTWVAAFDLFPVETIDNKARLLRQAADQQWWCGFGHDHAIAFAKIRQDGNRYSLSQTTA
jgi:glyoxylase-like metal-dependent hydrolase (beta-lactamase superfamily II)